MYLALAAALAKAQKCLTNWGMPPIHTRLLKTLTHRAWLRVVPCLPALAAQDLLRDPNYRRLWVSVLLSSLGSQVTLLALPLTAVVMLNATPSQMGVLSAIEMLPFVLFSLPAGVWLDRVRKLPVYVLGEGLLALQLLSVPLAWYLDWLSMPFLYAVGFGTGCVFMVAGTAAQIVLSQVVPRERLVEGHAKNALASSGAEVVGPGFAGVLIQLVGAPLALLADALMLTLSVSILRGIRVSEEPVNTAQTHFWRDLKEGLRFVASKPLLVSIAITMAVAQVFLQCAMVVQILFASRVLGLDEHQIGLCYVGLGVGTVLASMFGHRLSHRMGPGPCLLLGLGITGVGWLQLAFAPVGPWGVAAFVLMLLCFGFGAVLVIVNILALRQAVTPEPLLGRMTSTMRWLSLLGAMPGALLGGYLGEHWGLRNATGLGGLGTLLLLVWAWRYSGLRQIHKLPALQP